MATHDYVIANADGATVRADINSALAAIVSNNSSSSEPSTTYAYMLWYDTTNSILKIRNTANNAWIDLHDQNALHIDGTNNRVGIGTTSPSNDFHIKSSNPVIRLEDSDGGSTIYAQIFSDATGKLTFRADAGNAASSSKINFEIDGAEVQSIDASGHILKPLNSAFSAVLAADLDNKTGDGTTFTIDSTLGASFTEIYDKNSDFSNGVFTAPVDGRYLLHCAVFLDGFTANHTSGIVRFQTSNRNYDFFYAPRNMANVGTNLHAHATVIADLDSTDTARIQVFVGATDKTVDIKTASITRFAGELLG